MRAAVAAFLCLLLQQGVEAFSPACRHWRRAVVLAPGAAAARTSAAGDDAVKLVTGSELLFVVPLQQLKGEHFLTLRKLIETSLSLDVKDKVYLRDALTSVLDSSPFVQIVPDLLPGSSFVIFALGAHDKHTGFKESFLRWCRELGTDKVDGILIAQRDKYFRLTL